MAVILDELTDAVAEPVSALDAYRVQTHELQQALATVKDIQEKISSVAQQRDNVLQQRQRLLDSFEDESAVAELSKLGSRVEMCEAKLASLAVKLASAEVKMKAGLATFAVSFNSLFLMLRSFLIKDAHARVTAMLHPSVRIVSGGAIDQIAARTIEVVDFEPLAVRCDPMASFPNNALPPDAIQRDAERVLPIANALLAEAGRRVENGFVPPAAFSLEKWRASVSPGVPVPA